MNKVACKGGEILSIFEFNDPIITKKREQPYPQIIEELVVINNKILLTESPDKFNRVQIKDKNNQNQIYYEIEKNKETTTYAYYVDYLNGIVTVDSSQNNKTFICTYYGVSAPYFPASRIWTQENNGEVIETLDQIIENANAYLSISDQLINKGIYDSNTVYYKRNIVTYNDNSAYMYINELPKNNKPPTDENYWQEIINVKNIVNLLNSTNDTLNDSEIIRQSQEDIRKDNETIRKENEIIRINAENARIAGGALIKSGDTMTGVLNMGNNEIQLGGFKIKYNPNLNSIDFDF